MLLTFVNFLCLVCLYQLMLINIKRNHGLHLIFTQKSFLNYSLLVPCITRTSKKLLKNFNVNVDNFSLLSFSDFPKYKLSAKIHILYNISICGLQKILHFFSNPTSHVYNVYVDSRVRSFLSPWPCSTSPVAKTRCFVYTMPIFTSDFLPALCELMNLSLCFAPLFEIMSNVTQIVEMST